MAYTPTDNPYIPGDPYSYDLKWIVAKIKEALSSIEGLTTGQSDLSNDFEALREYVYNYFDNLDISQEVEDKINELYADGFFDDIIEEWMNGHIKWTNPNLLDNPWFTTGSLVNQRGVTDGQIPTGSTYLFDRWKSGYFTTRGYFYISNGYLRLDNTGGTSVNLLEQIIPTSILNQINGKTITLSILMVDNNIYSGSVVFNQGTDQVVVTIPDGGALQMRSNNAFRIVCSADRTLNIKAVKLELGPYSTLANDVPANYEDELNKCQHYFIRIGAGYKGLVMATSASAANITLSIPKMRATPTGTKTGTINLSTATGTNIAVNSIAVSSADLTGGFVYIQNFVTGATQGSIYRYIIAADSYIDLSADL